MEELEKTRECEEQKVLRKLVYSPAVISGCECECVCVHVLCVCKSSRVIFQGPPALILFVLFLR